MLLHLGGDYLVNINDIIGIFDLDITLVNSKTGKFFKEAEKDGNIITIDNELPKSFVVIEIYNEIRIYLTSLSSATLRKRIEKSKDKEEMLYG